MKNRFLVPPEKKECHSGDYSRKKYKFIEFEMKYKYYFFKCT